MKNSKKIAVVVLVVVILTTSVPVFAADFKRPVEIVSELTDQSVECLREQRLGGEVYGEIAEKYGVRNAFIEQVLEIKKAFLDEKIENDDLTQEEADIIIENICSNEKLNSFGKEFSAGFGKGLHMNEDGQGKKVNMDLREDNKNKGNNMNKSQQGKGFGNSLNN